MDKSGLVRLEICIVRIAAPINPLQNQPRYTLGMAKNDTEVIREALRGQGVGDAELETGVLAYRIANNLPLGHKSETMDEMKQLITTYLRDTNKYG